MEFNLADLHDAVSDAIGDRECIVWRDRRLTYAEVADRTNRLANHLIAAGLGAHGRARRPRRARERAGPPRVLPPQRQRVPRVDARRLQGPGGAVQRELPLRGRGAPLPAQRRGRHARSCSTPPSPIAWPRCCPTCPALTVLLQVDDGTGADLLPGAQWYEDALAAASPDRPDVERSPDDLYILYTGGTTGHAQGRAVAAGRHLRRRPRRAEPRHRRRVRERRAGGGGRPQRRRPPPARTAVHARRRPLARVQRHEQRQHDLHPGRHRRPRRRRHLAHDRAREGQHPADRRRRLRAPARRPARGCRPPPASPTTCRRCSW